MPHARPERRAARRLAGLAAVATVAAATAAFAAPPAAAPQAAAPQAATPAPSARPAWPHARLEIHTAGGRRSFAVDVADTPDRQELGLMNVRMLPVGLGMVFPVEPVRRMQMWMKDTLIPLDMLFIDEANRVACVRERTTPLSLAIVECPQPSRLVLEIAAGEARRLGIRPGDTVAYPADRP